MLGGKLGKPFSNAGVSSVVKRMNVTDATVHGFRFTIPHRIGEKTQFNPVIAVHRLTHSAGDASERTFASDQLLEKRFDRVDIGGCYVTSQSYGK